MNASPISMGLLSERGPPAWHPATQDIKDTCAQAAKYCQVIEQVNVKVKITKVKVFFWGLE